MSDFAGDRSGTGGRKRASPSPTGSAASSSKKSRKSKSSPGSEKSNRGLRHFSMMVCQKVEEKGTTTYNEVADELVRKVLAEREQKEKGKFDEKNIRRRVYDALNVLMAMDIISKEKKDITWKGLPTGCRQDIDSLRKEVQTRQEKLQQKRDTLRELLVQQVCFRNLITHNHSRGMSDEKIPMPFVVVNTHSSAVIQCDMSRDRTDVMFEFSMPFEINDDNTILKKMRMDKASISTLQDMLPKDLMAYCQENRLLDSIVTPERSQHRRSPELHHSAMPYHRQRDRTYRPQYDYSYDPLA